MYFYFPNQRYWNDKVAQIVWKDFLPWAVYEVDGERAVSLWDQIAFGELVKPYRRDDKSPESMHCVFENVVWSQSLELLHWFVNHWFTSYHKSFPLRLWDLDQLIKRKKKGRKKKGGEWTIQNTMQNESYSMINALWPISLSFSLSPSSWQTLIIFPTVWSMHMHLKDTWLMEMKWSVLLHGQLHASARAKAFRAIKSWSVHTIYATYSQIFRDRNILQKIILIDQHAWWYKNMQDPRYFVPTVVEKISEIHACEVIKTWPYIAS